jgi:hypothetical protein
MTRVAGTSVLATAFLFLALASAGEVGDFPKGTFAATVNGDEWALRFDGKGKVIVTHKDNEVVEGKYKVVKDEVEFTDVKGPYAEKGAAKTGTYQWKLADKKLTFTKVKDEARGRSGTLTSGPWEMKE